VEVLLLVVNAMVRFKMEQSSWSVCVKTITITVI
jgi:hypothetical protein